MTKYIGMVVAFAPVIGLLGGCATLAGTAPKPAAASPSLSQDGLSSGYQSCAQHSARLAECLINWVMNMSKEGRQLEVYALLEEKLKEEPDNKALYLAMAQLDILLHQEEKAQEQLRLVLENNPQLSLARLLMGISYFKVKKYEAARLIFQDTLRLDPENALLHLWLAHALRHLKEPKEAMVHYEKAVSLRADLADGMGNYGVLLLEQGEVAKSKDMLQKAVVLQPGSAEGWMNLGNAYLLLKQDEQAYEAYQEALRLNPQSVPLSFNRGLLFLTGELKGFGLTEKAQASYDAFLYYSQKANLGPEENKQMQTRLNSLKEKIEIEKQRQLQKNLQQNIPPKTEAPSVVDSQESPGEKNEQNEKTSE